MYSRAHLLIAREYEKLQNEPLWGIETWPMYEDTIFEWMAKINGLVNTPWEGGIFKVYIKFDEHFNVRPPKMSFQTIPFHPNVEVSSGRPCVDFLDDYEKWNENFSLSMLLLSLQSLLANPVLKNAVNIDAAQMLRNSPQSYYQMVQECVVASQRVEAGGSPYIGTADSKVRFDKHPPEGVRTAPTRGVVRVSKLSFEDYHKTWSGIATSKTSANAVNPLLESIKDQHTLQKVHLGLPREEVEEQMRKQMEDHNTLMYGKFKSKVSPENVREARLAQLKKMKKIYLAPRQSPLPPNQDIDLAAALPGLQTRDDGNEGWEKEVDDLVKWTNNLDSNAIDAT
ncbi:ubiquitin-conjugating enzyme E2 U [Aplysia californica]|uniref:Ubiquitin-conjugating enzyme E2 U n=1 Tax=Aplysia californica TaxID=6500 RepID=A0ABM0K3P6_APLCA|nr:ubiquitin-conjugating enzyme E2 U [Aplysia californica]